ncbi:hypothetical protein GCM10022247_58630 [Allokutzneria multivorans]|uniref:Uncharacterized protein n=2 Tax=Allokutzneria multivorans TaxID=1142134 RepID=A0ABP7TGZ2_9PSEU
MSSTTGEPGLDRPRELKIDSVRPCELFTAENREEFKTDRPVKETKDSYFQTQVCHFLGRAEMMTISVNILLGYDMSYFAPTQPPVHTRLLRVHGFPAYEVYVDSEPGRAGCAVNIGVAQGQVLRAQAAEPGRYENPLPQEEVCRRARRAADLAFGNLLARG